MSVITRVESPSTLCWAPDGTSLCLGNVAGSVDSSFQTCSFLELLSPPLPVSSRIQVKDATFGKLAWGTKHSPEDSLGVLAAGMSSGAVLLWSPSSLFRGEQAPLTSAEKHRVAVSALEFHPTQENLLASGASDGEIVVWDLQNITAPVGKPPGAAGGRASAISAVAWNEEVGYILASANGNGETSLWDLREGRSIMSLQESSHSRLPCASLAWNPLDGRQLMVSYSGSPGIEVWDLRSPMAPKSILRDGHLKGVLQIRFNPHDKDILLSAGEDEIVCIWSASESRVLHSFALDGAPMETAWNPRIPGILAISSYSGFVTVQSIHNTGPDHVPSWLRSHSGMSFGFGGRTAVLNSDYPSCINLSSAFSNPEFVQASQTFQSTIEAGDLLVFCKSKVELAQSDEETNFWKLMDSLLHDNVKTAILKELGFSFPQSWSPDATLEAVPEAKDEHIDAESFFASLSKDIADTPPEVKAQSQKEASPSMMLSYTETEDDTILKRALLAGNFSKAVDQCFSMGSSADALVIASVSNDSDLIQSTRLKYLKSHKKSYLKDLLLAISNGDIAAYVSSVHADNWSETLAMILSFYGNTGKQNELCNVLGDRLLSEGIFDGAVWAFIASANLERIMSIWLQSQSDSALGLHSAIEKLFVLTQALKSHSDVSIAGAASYFGKYATFLAGEGQLSAAAHFLELASDSEDVLNDPEIRRLAERIYYFSDGSLGGSLLTPSTRAQPPVHDTHERAIPPSSEHHTPGPSRTLAQAGKRPLARPGMQPRPSAPIAARPSRPGIPGRPASPRVSMPSHTRPSLAAPLTPSTPAHPAHPSPVPSRPGSISRQPGPVRTMAGIPSIHPTAGALPSRTIAAPSSVALGARPFPRRSSGTGVSNSTVATSLPPRGLGTVEAESSSSLPRAPTPLPSGPIPRGSPSPATSAVYPPSVPRTGRTPASRIIPRGPSGIRPASMAATPSSIPPTHVSSSPNVPHSSAAAPRGLTRPGPRRVLTSSISRDSSTSTPASSVPPGPSHSSAIAHPTLTTFAPGHSLAGDPRTRPSPGTSVTPSGSASRPFPLKGTVPMKPGLSSPSAGSTHAIVSPSSPSIPALPHHPLMTAPSQSSSTPGVPVARMTPATLVPSHGPGAAASVSRSAPTMTIPSRPVGTPFRPISAAAGKRPITALPSAGPSGAPAVTGISRPSGTPPVMRPGSSMAPTGSIPSRPPASTGSVSPPGVSRPVSTPAHGGSVATPTPFRPAMTHTSSILPVPSRPAMTPTLSRPAATPVSSMPSVNAALPTAATTPVPSRPAVATPSAPSPTHVTSAPVVASTPSLAPTIPAASRSITGSTPGSFTTTAPARPSASAPSRPSASAPSRHVSSFASSRPIVAPVPSRPEAAVSATGSLTPAPSSFGMSSSSATPAAVPQARPSITPSVSAPTSSLASSLTPPTAAQPTSFGTPAIASHVPSSAETPTSLSAHPAESTADSSATLPPFTSSIEPVSASPSVTEHAPDAISTPEPPFPVRSTQPARPVSARPMGRPMIARRGPMMGRSTPSPRDSSSELPKLSPGSKYEHIAAILSKSVSDLAAPTTASPVCSSRFFSNSLDGR